MAPCEFFSERDAQGQWDFVPVGLFNSVRTECWSQAGLLGDRVSSRLQLAQAQSCPQRGATGSQPLSTAITFTRTQDRSLTWSSTNLNATVVTVTFLEMCRWAWRGGGWVFCQWPSVQANLISLSRLFSSENNSYEPLPRAAQWTLRTEAREPRFVFPHMHKTSSLVLTEQQHLKCCCSGLQACLGSGHNFNTFFLVGAEVCGLDFQDIAAGTHTQIISVQSCLPAIVLVLITALQPHPS